MLFCFDSGETVEKIGQSVNVVIIIGKDRMGIDRVRVRERERERNFEIWFRY